MRFYWLQTWVVVVVCAPLAAGLVEAQAASYNGYFSIGWFGGLVALFLGFGTLFQAVCWLLDQT
jgi:hypothetical protein